MRLSVFVFVALLALALSCSGADRQRPHAPAHLSAMEHMSEAERHEATAAEHDAKAAQAATAEEQGFAMIGCKDRPLEGVSYSGGEELTVPRPCWTSVTNANARYRRAAHKQRVEAAAHRRAAVELWNVERTRCRSLGENEIAASPFTQREDILGAEEYREGTALRGVRVAFRKVPGLTARWMERSLQCHQARAAVLGFPEDFMSHCPITLPDVALSVVDAGAQIVVTMRSKRGEIAAAALGRVRDLTDKPLPR
jgi:hypothetical protein